MADRVVKRHKTVSSVVSMADRVVKWHKTVSVLLVVGYSMVQALLPLELHALQLLPLVLTKPGTHQR